MESNGKISRPIDTNIKSASGAAGSDRPYDIIRQSCGPCERVTCKDVPKAAWYCWQCDEAICHECKFLHRKFRPMENHELNSLHPPCGPCGKKKNTVDSDYFCLACEEFLCVECRSYHNLLASLEHHHIISSQEKVQSKPPAECFSKREAKFITKFDASVPSDSKSPEITGSAFLWDSRLLVIDDQNKSLKLFDVNYKFVTQKKCQSKLTGVSVIDNSEVVVTMGTRILRYSVEGNDIIYKGGVLPWVFPSLHYIRENGLTLWANSRLTYNSVSYISRDKLAVVARDHSACRNTFFVFSNSGRHLSALHLEEGSHSSNNDVYDEEYSPYHVAINKDKSVAYVTSKRNCNMLVLNIEISSTLLPFLNASTVLETYEREDLLEPHGVGVDRDWNVYVCGTHSNNIHQVTSNGKHIKVLLSEDDGLLAPLTISFSPSGDTFIVGCAHRFIYVYKMG